jgi:hypothetical protein
MGGRGGVLGTIGGVFILAVLDNTFNQLEVNAFLKDVVRGLIIIAAVAGLRAPAGEGLMSVPATTKNTASRPRRARSPGGSSPGCSARARSSCCSSCSWPGSRS